MKDPIENVWLEVKRSAQHFASIGVVPSATQAAVLVRRFAAEARCSPQPPPEALAFFASELVALSREWMSGSQTAV